jgi:AbrB family looped-hinge helix DNA binding protein
MSAATLTAKGQIVIPAKIRARHGLTPGTQVEFVDAPDGIRLIVRRRITPTDPAAGYGMIKVPPPRGGLKTRRLSSFDTASSLRRHKPAQR